MLVTNSLKDCIFMLNFNWVSKQILENQYIFPDCKNSILVYNKIINHIYIFIINSNVFGWYIFEVQNKN